MISPGTQTKVAASDADPAATVRPDLHPCAWSSSRHATRAIAALSLVLAAVAPCRGRAETASDAATPARETSTDAAKAGAADGRPAGASASAKGKAAKSQETASPKPAAVQHFDIDDFAIDGADKMPQIDLEEAIYPFLGPGKTPDDVEKARAALEKSYHDKGFQTVSVSVPPQNVQGGRVKLKVAELKVGRLRVRNSRYFDLGKIKESAPSLKEGTVPNFNEVTKDIVSLNQWPDRRVTPALRAGVTPGTVDVDLNVEDKLPLHGNLEVNNRKSPSTTPLRVSGTIRYDNLWQLGHSISFTYQVAPQRPSDASVVSASYLARVPDVDWLNILAYGVVSKSSVATVGGVNVVGPGEIGGTRAVITLPTVDKLFHSISLGLDYKHFQQTVALGQSSFSSPVTYYPLVGSYTATVQDEKFTTLATASVLSNLPTISSDHQSFDNKRVNASPSFTHVNFDIAHTQQIGQDFELYAHLQAQKADGPLVSSEQFSGGGLDTVRGYLESEVLGDDGIAGTIEVRSPDLVDLLKKQTKGDVKQGSLDLADLNEWRVFAFADAARVSLLKPLPEQTSRFNLASYGIGTRFKIYKAFNGTIIGSIPIITQAYTRAGTPRINFRVWGEF